MAAVLVVVVLEVAVVGASVGEGGITTLALVCEFGPAERLCGLCADLCLSVVSSSAPQQNIGIMTLWRVLPVAVSVCVCTCSRVARGSTIAFPDVRRLSVLWIQVPVCLPMLKRSALTK